ncbi:MAG: ATP-dependent Clp protease proteolytic subunit [Candidatus Lambdaproteobacteria bacterium RIFOXYD2_FULL_50_16]|uniref:ATP-dependent Clp protease proteolytic subunit n=1 Tax=Candidatus Lambdaproteobacteria bacterium RIFOXYD2_FULL_50_16 TaxID=1817772 RepID=A0A1F6GD88_9PROT|nr:MAG: ATP-dependent Clp protease proteolytic subunit [Candidatus Lambdaproteobacteria bacterium RIFOXYD2_FULL_50_16]
MQLNKEEEQEQEGQEEQGDKLNKALLETRSIIISSAVDSKLADRVMKHILILEELDPKKEIKVFINSPGGEIYSGFAICDLLSFVSCPVTTIVTGLAASMGSILSLFGDDGRRFATPNSRIMIHQPLLSGAQGQITDLEIHSRQILKTRENLAGMYAEKTGKSVKKILKDMDRDHWLNADEALEYGLIDRVIKHRSEI